MTATYTCDKCKEPIGGPPTILTIDRRHRYGRYGKLGVAHFHMCEKCLEQAFGFMEMREGEPVADSTCEERMTR